MYKKITDFPTTLTVAIPAYKAEQELRTFFPSLLSIVPVEQVVVCNDGAFDQTEQFCVDSGVHCISHVQNRGKGAALSTLFEHSAVTSRWIITMDADGQHSVDDLPQFIDAITNAKASCGIICGSRSRRGSSMPLLRRFSNGSTSWFISLVTRQKIKDSQCGFRAYRSEMVSSTHCLFNRFEMESEILIRAAALGWTIENVSVQTVYNGGPSHISHVRDTLRWIIAVVVTLWRIRRKRGSY